MTGVEWRFVWLLRPFSRSATIRPGQEVALNPDSTVGGTVQVNDPVAGSGNLSCEDTITFTGGIPGPAVHRPPGYPRLAIDSNTGKTVRFLLPIPMSQGSAFTGTTFFTNYENACYGWGPWCFGAFGDIKKLQYGNFKFNTKSRDPVKRTPEHSCTLDTPDGSTTISWRGTIRAYEGDPPPR